MKKTFLLIILAVIGCDSDEITKGRSFYMGFTFNHQETFSDNTFEDSDIINYHFDEGVPWTNIILTDLIPNHILDSWNLRKMYTPLSHKIYVSVSPLSFGRNKLANDNSFAEKIISGFDSISFTDSRIKTGYLKYCKQIINYFKPNFFNMSADANLFYLLKPDLWQAFIEFHAYVYEELKSSYPDLAIFTSVAAEPALEGFIPKTDHLLQKLAILQLLEHSDLYSLSICPNSISSISNSKNKDSFAELFNISKKPFALTIISRPHLMSPPPHENGLSNQMDSDASLEVALKACLKREAVFVISSNGGSLNIDPNLNLTNLDFLITVWKKYLSVDFN